MNILIYVVTILMLLTLLGYARIDSYRNSQLFYLLFQHYMEEDERGYINLAQTNAYEATVASPRENTGDNKKRETAIKGEGSPRINIKALVDKTTRTQDKEGWSQSQLMLRNLIHVLYQDQEFYKEAEKERPGFIDELFAAIEMESEKLPKEKRIKSAKELANLELPDEELNTLLYKMLHGAPSKYEEEEEQKQNQPLLIMSDEKEKEEEDTSQDTELLKQEATEYKSSKGYFSLLDFVTIGRSNKIRVYLAPKEVLQAIFQNTDTVNNILRARRNLFSQIISGGNSKELSEVFKNDFSSQRDSGIQEKSLDFTVTKTNPKYYE